MNVQRFDYADLKAVITDEGFLRDSPVVGRIGIQEYRNADGSIRRELRLPEEVFNADALASFVGKPITVDHPKTGRVTAADAHRVTVGTMLAEGKQDGDTVRADIVIHSPDAIGNRRQLSLGYMAEMDMTPGEWNGQKYDAIQRKIRVNHLSVVHSARAGSVAKLNMDGNEEVDFIPQKQEQHTMTVKVKLDNGLEYDAAPEVSRELEKLRADTAEVQIKLKTKTDEVAKGQAKIDTLEAEVKGFQAKLDSARSEGKAEALARVKLEEVAKGFKVDCKDMTDRQVKEAVIKSIRKDADLTDKSDVYVDAAFDLAVSMKDDVAMAKQRKDALNNDGGNGGHVSADEKYRQMMANLGNREE